MNLREQKAFRPRVEALEDRTTPTVSISPAGSTLNISSNNASDRVTIRDNGDGDLRVFFNGGSFQGNNFRRIRLNMRGGNDRVTYTQSGSRTRSMLVQGNLGNGDDNFRASVFGNILAGRSLDFQIFGGNGSDTIDLSYQGEIDGLLNYTLDGEGGNESAGAFVRATIRATSGSTGQIGGVGGPATVAGNLGDDSLGHFVFKDANDIFLPVSARVDGGPGFFFFLPGNDVCNRTSNVTGVNCESDFVI